MAERSTLSRLAGLAEDQWGLLTRRQAERAGVSRATLQRLASQGALRRVAHGVYLLAGAPSPDLLDLRAAWLQLAPETRAWERSPDQGVASHRSAAAAYELGHLPADRHDFTLPVRRQSRRPDVRLHNRRLEEGDVRSVRGLWVTRPATIAADLLNDREDPEAIGQVIADAVREGHEAPEAFASSLSKSAVRYGFRSGDGAAVLRWLLDLVGDPEPGGPTREVTAQ